MQIWHRIAIAHLVILAALLLVMSAGRRQVNALRNDVAQASEEYEELRAVSATNASLVSARSQIDHHRHVNNEARKHLNLAADQLGKFLGLQDDHTTERPHQDEERKRVSQSLERIRAILREADTGEPDLEADLERIDQCLADVQYLSSFMDQIVADTHESATRQVRQSDWWLLITPIVALFLATGAGLWQYYSVVRPVQKLRRGASAMAEGNLTNRVDESGRDEVAALAADFNRMASELEALYRDMEQQVRTKSRELAHAERLSSVGFLAAGVAHEINNPLSIIHGYAQEAREQGVDPAKLDAVLDVILDESRRCRDIVRRLLSLASPGEPTRTVIDVFETAASVVALVRELPRYRGRCITIDSSNQKALVTANPDELKQVLLNLTINALEATRPGDGVVRIGCSCSGDSVVIEVVDNGVGMNQQTLDRVFDPFFTTRKSNGQSGVGLGLSISFAIIQQHGGHITAHSDGPGQGSRFAINLPVAENEAKEANV